MTEPQTPFPATGYFGPEYFCDREEELDQLIRNIRGGNSTVLIALRRLGKTALIRHLFHHLAAKYIRIYVDILSTETLGDMLNQLSTAMVSEFPEKSTLGRKVWQMIRSLRPVICFDALSGIPLISIKTSPEESRKSIGELLSLMEKQSRPVVIAIDEFQQILEYPEQQTDAWLRSLVQKLKNVCFVFSGSQQHLMTDLFANPGRPFFRSAQFMKIGKLREETYRDFILNKFRAYGKAVEDGTVSEMLEWTYIHTYYTQLLCNRVFLTTGKRVTSAGWKQEAGRLLKEQEFVFFGYREMLTRPQWELLKAIAVTGSVYQPTASDFISGHNLGSSATVLRSLDALMRKELIYRETDSAGKSYYGIYDVLFGRWLGR